jgi:hypothetical protein
MGREEVFIACRGTSAATAFACCIDGSEYVQIALGIHTVTYTQPEDSTASSDRYGDAESRLDKTSQPGSPTFYAEDVEFIYSRAAAYTTSFGITVS